MLGHGCAFSVVVHDAKGCLRDGMSLLLGHQVSGSVLHRFTGKHTAPGVTPPRSGFTPCHFPAVRRACSQVPITGPCVQSVQLRPVQTPQ